jgi:hypothetical protein
MLHGYERILKVRGVITPEIRNAPRNISEGRFFIRRKVLNEVAFHSIS